MPDQRVWLITGASQGIGLELARVALSRGDRVIAASRNPEKVKATLAPSEYFAAARLDHNEPLPQLKAAMENIIAIFGTVDVVVNNAAYVQTGLLEEISPEDTVREFQANVFGPLNIYRAILPHLREKRSGTLLTIGSMAAWYPMPGCNLYNASKAAIRWIGIGIAQEISSFGIQHCLIEPGFFRTNLLDPASNIAKTDNSQRLPAYSELNATVDKNFEAFHGNQLGDPVKGAEIIYEVATSTGVASKKKLPSFLALGSDASDELVKAAKQVIEAVEELREISVLTDRK